MAKFVLYIDVENAAFDVEPQFEVGRIMQDLSEKFTNGEPLPDKYRNLYDINGNIVGKYAIKRSIKIIAE